MLHGGPGAGCSAKMRASTIRRKYRIVLFDQRGSGRSTPHADLVDNTTWHLVADIEALREARHRALAGVRRQLGLDAGAGLRAGAPERVTELVLRGIFMLRRWELEWFYQEGASRLFPDAWEHVPRGDPGSNAAT
jgi:proline iminopeptidase